MRKFIWVLIALLIVLHHDFWFWEDTTLILGFLPTGLLYHIGISLAAAAIWYVVTLVAWPTDDPASPKGEV